MSSLPSRRREPKPCILDMAFCPRTGYIFGLKPSHFVEELEKINVKFVGPPSPAIHAMGDKIESKKIAKEAKVNIIPGFLGEVHNNEEVIKIGMSPR